MRNAIRDKNSKAIHRGHCQVCGACQKLPGDVLAKHGYTTRCGFFEGVCLGSGHLPFEQDTTLIEDAIFRARVKAETLRAEAERTRSQGDPADCWYHAYFAGNRRGESGYRWIKTKIDTPTDARVPRLSYWHPGDSRPARWEQAGYYGTGAAEVAARYFNGLFADDLERQAQNVDTYIAWQEGRIRDWTPQPLILID